MKLHQDDVDYFEHIKRVAHMTAERFDLVLKGVDYKKHAGKRILGLCSNTKEIKLLIRLTKDGCYAVTRVPEEVIFYTLAHELAHLRHFDHGKEHTNFTRELFQFLYYRKEKTK